MNRFFDLESILSRELLPKRLQELNLPTGHPQFELVDAIRFKSDIAGGVIVVPAGMLSDLASIPQEVQGVFMTNDDPRISAAAWVHDFLCDRKGKFTREDGQAVSLSHTDCAKILAYEGMADLGANMFQRNAVFEAVNLFGPKWQ